VFRFNLGALALAAALVAPLAASAQTAPPPAAAPGAPAPGTHHHHHRGGMMHALRALNLSDAQKTQIAGIMKSARDAHKNQTTPPDSQTRRANMMAMRQQIDSVLTDTQRAQLTQTLKAQRHMHKDGGAQRPQAPASQ
jgi:Spy/CpxP family protein refolding chaperone